MLKEYLGFKLVDGQINFALLPIFIDCISETSICLTQALRFKLFLARGPWNNGRIAGLDWAMFQHLLNPFQQAANFDSDEECQKFE